MEMGALNAMDIDSDTDSDEDNLVVEAEGPIALDGTTLMDGDRVVVVGMIVGRRTLVTKNNKMMEFIQLEDMTGVGEIIVFPNTYERYNTELQDETILVITGHLNFKEGEQPKIIADSVVNIDRWNNQMALGIGPGTASQVREPISSDMNSVSYMNKQETPAQVRKESPGISIDAVKIRIPEIGDRRGAAGLLTEKETMEKIKEIISRYPGDNQVLIYLRDGKIVSTGGEGNGKGVKPTLDFAEETALLVGNANIKIKHLAR